MHPTSRTLHLLRRALQANQASALAVHVRRRGVVLCDETVGFARRYTSAGVGTALQPLADPEPLTHQHLFDLSSVSKVVATTLATLALISDGKLQLTDPVHNLLPLPPAPGRVPLQIWHLLTHRSGLPAWVPLYFDLPRRADLLAALAPYVAHAVPGVHRQYSDLGFLLLGAVIEAQAGCSLEAYLERRVWQPLQLTRTCYAPGRKGRRHVVATSHANVYERRMIDEPSFGLALPPAWHARPSQVFLGWRNHSVQGEVDDGNAHYAMEGVAGHAGQFSTAAELTTLCRALTGPPGCPEVQALRLSEPWRQRFVRRHRCGAYLGWFPGAELAGHLAPPGTLVMRGFTGTVVIACPARDLQLAVLGNREHPSADGHYPSLGPLFKQIFHAWLQAPEGRL